MNDLAKVVLIDGKADTNSAVHVVTEKGGSKLLQLNDDLASGDTVIVSDGTVIELQLASGGVLRIPSGQMVKLTAELLDVSLSEASDSAIAYKAIDAIAQAINEGGAFKVPSSDSEASVGAETALSFEAFFKAIQLHEPLTFALDQEEVPIGVANADLANSSSGDLSLIFSSGVLDLRDLLMDAVEGVNAENLADYLHFEVDGDDTVVYINSNGGYSKGIASVQDVQTITLAGADLVNGLDSDSLVIENLLAHNKLILD